MNRARLDYVARRMAPRKIVVSVQEYYSAPLVISSKTVVLSCGHQREVTLHHCHKVGDHFECPDCGRALALETDEFRGLV